MYLKHADTLLIVVLCAAYGAVGAALWLWLGILATVPLLVLLLGIVTALLLHLFRTREMQDVRQLRQVQALFSLFQLVPIRAPLPWMTGWAATPEFALTLYQLVRERRPETIVELGSGASTVIMAAALDQNDRGHLICVDHDSRYLDQTRRELARQGTERHVDVVHAPIAPVVLEGSTWLWYDEALLPPLAEIDMLVIDGPNRELQRRARYPALPVLFPRLSADAVIVLDDAHRKDEKRAVNEWLKKYDGLTVEYLDSPKGTAILRKS